MNQGLLHEVPEIAPAEASPTVTLPRESAFAEHLRLLDNAVSLTRARAERQEKELLSLQAQVRRIRENFQELKTRAEDVELGLPLPPVEPAKEPLIVPPPLAVSTHSRIKSLWPYAVLAAAALALGPRRPSPMPQLSAGLARPSAAPVVDTGKNDAIALVRSFKAEGSKRSFGDLIGKELDSQSDSAWDVQKVADGSYLVSFHPQGAFGPESSYDFTVDLGERTVTPEPDTTERLVAGR